MNNNVVMFMLMLMWLCRSNIMNLHELNAPEMPIDKSIIIVLKIDLNIFVFVLWLHFFVTLRQMEYIFK